MLLRTTSGHVFIEVTPNFHELRKLFNVFWMYDSNFLRVFRSFWCTLFMLPVLVEPGLLIYACFLRMCYFGYFMFLLVCYFPFIVVILGLYSFEYRSNLVPLIYIILSGNLCWSLAISLEFVYHCISSFWIRLQISNMYDFLYYHSCLSLYNNS